MFLSAILTLCAWIVYLYNILYKYIAPSPGLPLPSPNIMREFKKMRVKKSKVKEELFMRDNGLLHFSTLASSLSRKLLWVGQLHFDVMVR